MALSPDGSIKDTCPSMEVTCGTVTFDNGETVAMVPKLMTEDEMARFGNHPMLKGKTRFTCRPPVIGGYDNTDISVSRLGVLKKQKQLSDSGNGLSGLTVYDRYWLKFASGNFSLGRYGNEAPFFNWLDPNPLEFSSIGLMTWLGSTGRWKFHSFC
ncbi:uncharacterized protein [Diadema antillarum]|uniref:uncharacterized protein n=1 Tax=Diadema antillarum TaxID=105358 RepID=UPI003A8AAA07